MLRAIFLGRSNLDRVKSNAATHRMDSSCCWAHREKRSNTYLPVLSDPLGVRRGSLGQARVAIRVQGATAVPPVSPGGEPRPGAPVVGAVRLAGIVAPGTGGHSRNQSQDK